ncbi:J domain-containing protein [Marinobacter sp.]|uniref:J domain-containing protein n=1 Tax=Marinobacter sp. TaxID=50741 RepID=UPI000C638E1B|nr:J domain-containing protein [Marinobacter sp.]MBE94888.1 molecular chaperone DnaJ [Marinobacter sp.]|tara:strand:+ start:619 stop:1287 length:669 start_codon:yes stop_codon:yes gene_type:complete
MNCWEVLGIEPTGDHARIRAAYEQQEKFASGEELERLRQAFKEATGGEPQTDNGPSDAGNEGQPQVAEPPATVRQEAEGLDASERQVVREVVIQVRALLNDSSRSKDAQIWKAILGEPPADQSHVRREIADALEPQVRPMAQNGSFPAPVVQFLAGWFDWHSLRDVQEHDAEEDLEAENPTGDEQPQEELPPQMVNFWPAVIGWIVGLAVLATLFSGMGGGG